MADRAFQNEEEFFKASGLKDFSTVQEIADGVNPTGRYYKRAGNAAVFENAAFDPNAERNNTIARLAGQSGMSLDDLRSLIGSGLPAGTEEEIRKSLGIDALESRVFTPAPSTEKLFTDAYAAAGLADVKKKIEELAGKKTNVSRQLNERMLGVNENPWLSETSRLNNIKNTKDFFQGDISAISEEEATLRELFNTGLNEVSNLVTRRSADFANQQAIDSAQLNYLINRATQELSKREKAEAGKIARYLPEYFTAKIGSSKPETITTSDGAIYQWDKSAGRFVEIRASQADITVNPETGELYDKRTGQVVNGSSGFVGTFSKPGTLAERNNNPGNLRFAGQQGATQGQGGFAAFPTLQAGLDALRNDLLGKMTGNTRTGLTGNSTVQDLINVYAPKGDGNDPTTYAKNLANALGVSTSTKLSTLVPRIDEVVNAVAKFESGFSLSEAPKPLTKSQRATVEAMTDDVRNDKDISDFISVRDGYERIRTGAQLGEGPGDLAILFGYMKMLDPTSVVRETEFDNAESALGYAQKILNIPSKFLKGTRLTEEGRKHFVNAAERLYDAKEGNYEKAYSQYENRAIQSGIDPALVLRDYGVAPASVTEVIEKARRKGQSDDSIVQDLLFAGIPFQQAVAMVMGNK